MNRTTQQGVSLPAMAPPRRYRVTFQDKSTFEGTRREILTANPAWWKYAVEIVEPVAPAVADDEDDRIYDTRLPSSSIHYQTVAGQRVRAEWQPGTVVQRRRSAQKPANETEDIPQARQKRQRRGLRAHPLLLLGIGMIVMLALWQLLQAGVTWWSVHTDDVTYGRPRTWQTDAVVGHNGDSAASPSHFIFLNLNRRVEVIEFPAGDASKAKIYLGPTLFTDGAELIPVTGEFIDVNGDGHLDMIIKIQDQRIVFINTGDGFRPLNPGEKVTLPKS